MSEEDEPKNPGTNQRAEPTWSGNESIDRMLAHPKLLDEPIFPHQRYLEVFAHGFFNAGLTHRGEKDLIAEVKMMANTSQLTLLGAGYLAFWAIDLDEVSDNGTSGRDVFIARVKTPVQKPPVQLTEMAGTEQHLQAAGVVNIQTGEEEGSRDRMIRTVGWCMLALIRSTDPESDSADRPELE